MWLCKVCTYPVLNEFLRPLETLNIPTGLKNNFHWQIGAQEHHCSLMHSGLPLARCKWFARGNIQGSITNTQAIFFWGLLWWIISETPCWTLPLDTTSVSECFIWIYETLSKHSRPACVGGWLPHWIECKHLLSDHLAFASPRMGIQCPTSVRHPTVLPRQKHLAMEMGNLISVNFVWTSWSLLRTF